MSESVHSLLRRPRHDERQLNDVSYLILGNLLLLAAHDLRLFPLLAEHPSTVDEVCSALSLARRPAEALLAACTAAGLIQLRDDGYSLTPLAEDYLLPSSPTYFGGNLDWYLANPDMLSYAALKQAILTDAPQLYGGGDLFKTHEQQAARARAFTHSMHGMAIGPAQAWPDAVDLSGHRVLLDVGGGSGAHAIGATSRWPQLQAVVFDLAPICELTKEFVASYGLHGRITTHPGDMWSDPFPAADVHFYSLIYHDWRPEKCRSLTEKSFAALPPGGRIIIHERLFVDDKTGPFAIAGVNALMLMTTEGQQYSGRELSAMLAEAGFSEIEVKPTTAYWSIVTGRKP
ncbi:MAG: methyltransferase [Chloroflexi bacterium]|nr:methyltransferase [Chloroflexota bacterium]